MQICQEPKNKNLLEPHGSDSNYCFHRCRDVLNNDSEEILNVVKKLLAALSVTLGLPEKYLENAIVEPYQKRFINYYPSCPLTEVTAGFYSLSDIGMATLLLQEPGSNALHLIRYTTNIAPSAAMKRIQLSFFYICRALEPST